VCPCHPPGYPILCQKIPVFPSFASSIDDAQVIFRNDFVGRQSKKGVPIFPLSSSNPFFTPPLSFFRTIPAHEHFTDPCFLKSIARVTPLFPCASPSLSCDLRAISRISPVSPGGGNRHLFFVSHEDGVDLVRPVAKNHLESLSPPPHHVVYALSPLSPRSKPLILGRNLLAPIGSLADGLLCLLCRRYPLLSYGNLMHPFFPPCLKTTCVRL